jgi:hypothetical protein
MAIVGYMAVGYMAIVGISLFILGKDAKAQNVVVESGIPRTADPILLSEADVRQHLLLPRMPTAVADDPTSRRVAQKLSTHVQEFIAGYPWKSFHHTLGISGYESYFNHPDRLFLSLATALPALDATTAAAAGQFLRSQLQEQPPWDQVGFDLSHGNPRERYQVPDSLRAQGRGQAASALGVYAFWKYVQATEDLVAATKDWPQILMRMKPLLENDLNYDIHQTGSLNDDAQHLNGDIAGFIGLWHLAGLQQDSVTQAAALTRLTVALQARVNLERANPHFLEPTRSASRQLHHYKLTRYVDLVPEVGHALHRWTDDLATDRLKSFRESRPTWYMAFGERTVGGENYADPPHIAHALFTGAAMIERSPAPQLLTWLDLPWCQGDLYFIEKCSLALLPPLSLPAEDWFADSVRPLLAQYCFECHGADPQHAEIDLTHAAHAADLTDREELWFSALQHLRAQTMPPLDESQPDAGQHRTMVNHLQRWADAVDAARPMRAGRVPLRRLNRVEYQNTVRQLLDIDLPLTDDFPEDDSAHGFDNVADGLTLSPLLLEKYLAAAQRALARAVVTDPDPPWIEQRWSANQLRGPARGSPLPAAAPASAVAVSLEQELAAEVQIPATEEYRVRVRAARSGPTADPATLVLRVDGVESQVWSVTSELTDAAVLDVTVPLGAGPRRIAVRHSWHTANVPKDVQLPDIHAVIESLEIIGPVRVAAHRKIFNVTDPTVTEPIATEPTATEPTATEPTATDEREAARQVLRGFGQRAFRRPVRDDEVQRWLQLYDRLRAAGRTPVESTRAGLAAILISPHFLFHIVHGEGLPDPHGAHPLTDWELASRLSYFLWSTMPDQELLDLAARGTLQDPAVLRQQVARMLSDPRSAALVDHFAGQWLGLRRLQTAAFDSEAFPQFNAALRQSMAEEARRFFETNLREGRPLVEFLDTHWTWMNQPLARLYGQKDVQGDEFRRVELQDPNRGGLVTMPAVLAVTSLPTRTSAVKRGKWILEELLGAAPPPPPPDVPELDVVAASTPEGATLRARLERHRADPRCISCHVQMDTLGLGLENFDAIGRWRREEAGRPIDAAGTLPDGTTFTSPSQLKGWLRGQQTPFVHCLTEKMLVYALGRGLTRHDRPVVQQIARQVESGDCSLQALIVEIACSYPFRYCESEPAAEKTTP